MKDIKKLNSALNDIDERLIEEAAQAGRARSVPGWVKYGAVIAGGAAAVIAVCIFTSGGGSRGVDLIAQSGSQTQYSAADFTSAEEMKVSASYDCWSAGLMFNTDDSTFTLFPCDVFDSTPIGTYTVSGSYISLYFTQLDDVKYRGRLSGDGKEITIVNPDELLYSWVLLADSGSEKIIAENGGEYPEIVFRWSSGGVISCGTSETTCEETAEHIIDEWSPEEANEMIKGILTEDDEEQALLSQIEQVQEETKALQDDFDRLSGAAGTAESESLSGDIEELDRVIGEKVQKSRELSGMLDRYRADRSERIMRALVSGNDPLSIDNVRVTAYSGYDEWTGGNHYGIDLTSPYMTEETEITAFLDGTVIKAADGGWNLGLGKYVVIDHGSGISTVYASLGSVDVSEGQEVSAGDTIARAGMTGRSTGIHLHFEIRENGEPSKLMNSYGKVKLCWVVVGDGGLISEVMDGYGGYYGHKGIDITAERGTPVLAAADGKVYTAEWTVGYGKCVMIDHDGYVTVYGHLDDIYVSDGEKVNRGDAIGTIGSTGYITGTALHFEVRFGDTDEYACIDPLSMLPEHARTSYCIEES